VPISGDDVVTDSWNIALYLHDHAQKPPPLLARAGQMAFAAFLNA